MTGSLSQTRGRPEPGRELDALIAERVMGWTKARYAPYPPQSKQAVAMCWHRRGIDAPCSLPEFSTDIADAWTVVEKLNAKERWPEIQFGPLESGELVWHIGLVNPADVQVYASTAPHAICLAALAALSPADDGGAR